MLKLLLQHHALHWTNILNANLTYQLIDAVSDILKKISLHHFTLGQICLIDTYQLLNVMSEDNLYRGNTKFEKRNIWWNFVLEFQPTDSDTKTGTPKLSHLPTNLCIGPYKLAAQLKNNSIKGL